MLITCQDDIESIVEGAVRRIEISCAYVVTLIRPIDFIKVFGIEFLPSCINPCRVLTCMKALT